jgi:cell division protein ZapE
VELNALYRDLVAEGKLRLDAGQEAVAGRLGSLAAALEKQKSQGFLGRLTAKDKGPAVKGLYIWGAVGRGKTMLLDLFFERAPGNRKRRVHFHAFMQDVHARIHAARKSLEANDAIAQAAQAIAAEAKLLCLDEMQIADIADAMIVGRLFETLFKQGTIIVTTSNLPPGSLYQDGLNRQLFVPFIKLMEAHLYVAHLDGPTDYRLGRVKGYETFITPLGPEASRQLQNIWQRLTDSESGAPVDIGVLGRKLRIPQAVRGCARFSFADLCEAPLGAPDYLALANSFQTVFIENIPALGPEKRNEAKRFVLLMDTLYDARRHLVVTSAEPPGRIYPAGDHRFEFNRTVSRLQEMQSASWWGGKIVET